MPAVLADKLAMFNPDLPQGAPPSNNPSQVAMFALGSQQVGHLPLRFSK